MSENMSFFQRFDNLLKSQLLYRDFAQKIVEILSDACSEPLASKKLSEIVQVAEKYLDETLIPIDMLAQVIENYTVVSIADLEENKDEIIALSNWCAQMAEIPLEIKPSTISGAGYGLFATEDILKNGAITTYGGKIVKHDAAFEGAYVLQFEKGASIDGSSGFRLCEMGRWANGFPPHLIWKTDQRNNAALTQNPFERNRLCVASSMLIVKGSEIFAEYGLYYDWEHLGYEMK